MCVPSRYEVLQCVSKSNFSMMATPDHSSPVNAAIMFVRPDLGQRITGHIMMPTPQTRANLFFISRCPFLMQKCTPSIGFTSPSFFPLALEPHQPHLYSRVGSQNFMKRGPACCKAPRESRSTTCVGGRASEGRMRSYLPRITLGGGYRANWRCSIGITGSLFARR